MKNPITYLQNPCLSSKAHHQRKAQTLSYLTSSRFRRIIRQKHSNLGKTFLSIKKFSSTVQGFYMCCSGHGRRLSALSVLKSVQGIQHMAPKCPSGLQSNGQRCTVNEIEGCPGGYICIGNGLRGVCCKAQPRCQKKRRPYYIAKKQVLTCADDETGWWVEFWGEIKRRKIIFGE
jgi:hypothetical protein